MPDPSQASPIHEGLHEQVLKVSVEMRVHVSQLQVFYSEYIDLLSCQSYDNSVSKAKKYRIYQIIQRYPQDPFN